MVDRLTEVARKGLGKPNMQVALAWILGKPFVTAPIIGASKPHHLDDAVAALEMQAVPRGREAVGGAVPTAPDPGARLI